MFVITLYQPALLIHCRRELTAQQKQIFYVISAQQPKCKTTGPSGRADSDRAVRADQPALPGWSALPALGQIAGTSPFLAGQACSLELCHADSIGFRLVVAAQGPTTLPSQPNRRIAESPRRSFWPNRRIARPCSAIRRDADNPGQ